MCTRGVFVVLRKCETIPVFQGLNKFLKEEKHEFEIWRDLACIIAGLFAATIVMSAPDTRVAHCRKHVDDRVVLKTDSYVMCYTRLQWVFLSWRSVNIPKAVV